MAVVDASVIISAILSTEPYHNACKTWLDTLVNSGQQFSAPSILLSEVAAPISHAYDQPELAERISNGLMKAPFVHLVPVTLALAKRAADIASYYKIRGCDAVYIALAEQLGEELVTLDNQQNERSQGIISSRRP